LQEVHSVGPLERKPHEHRCSRRLADAPAFVGGRDCR
jgi:hypothetical protein